MSSYAITFNWRDPETVITLRVAGTVGLTQSEAQARWSALPEVVDGEVQAELWKGSQFIDTVAVRRATVERQCNKPFEDMIQAARRMQADELDRVGESERANRLRAVLRRRPSA